MDRPELASLASVMRRRFVAVAPDESLRDAEALMRMGRFRALPVVAAGRLAGMLCYAPMVRTLLGGDVDVPGALERALFEVPVATLMDAKPATVRPDASLVEAASCLVRTEIGCVPVVDGRDELLGIVTEADLIRLRVAAAEALRP